MFGFSFFQTVLVVHRPNIHQLLNYSAGRKIVTKEGNVSSNENHKSENGVQ